MNVEVEKKVEHFLSQENFIPLFKSISKRNTSKNFLIGGCVRDCLLNKVTKDLDIVTTENAEKLAQETAKELGVDKVVVFKNFGTAMFRYNDIDIEFVTARKESYRSDSRKPTVQKGTLEDDQKRRDFTINSLSISLNQEDYGNLIDPFNGIQDLQNKIIKTPLEPSITYSDDPLRMMRAIRFASQLNFKIDNDSFNAIHQNAHRIEIISKERIITELNKIVLSPVPSLGFKLLEKSKLLHIIFPELIQLKGVEIINNIGHKDNFYHTLQVLDNIALKTDDLWLRWAAILHDIAKPKTKRFHKTHGWTFHGHEDLGAKMVPGIFKKLRLPLDHKMKYVQKLVRLHLRPIALTKEEITDSALRRILFEAGDDIEDLMTLCEADITSKNKFKVAKYLERFANVRKKLKDVEERDKIRNWQPPITGEEIMRKLKLAPSKHIGTIKTAIKDAILDGKIENTQEAAEAFMYEKAKELNIIT